MDSQNELRPEEEEEDGDDYNNCERRAVQRRFLFLQTNKCVVRPSVHPCFWPGFLPNFLFLLPSPFSERKREVKIAALHCKKGGKREGRKVNRQKCLQRDLRLNDVKGTGRSSKTWSFSSPELMKRKKGRGGEKNCFLLQPFLPEK